MSADEITLLIYAKREEQRNLANRRYGVPDHIADEVELRLREIDAELRDLNAQLYRANGGKE